MLGIWNKTGKARKLWSEKRTKAAICSSQASGRPLFWPPNMAKSLHLAGQGHESSAPLVSSLLYAEMVEKKLHISMTKIR